MDDATNGGSMKALLGEEPGEEPVKMDGLKGFDGVNDLTGENRFN